MNAENTLLMSIDWELLRKQKAALMSTIFTGTSYEDELQGLVHLIDAIQDQACAAGVPEEEIFGDTL